MTNVGGFTPPPEQPISQFGPAEFSEVIEFVWLTGALVIGTLTYLSEVDDIGDEIRTAIPGVQARVWPQALQVIGQILGGEHADALRRHGLINGDPEWIFKYAVFRSALADAAPGPTLDDDPETRRVKIRDFLGKIRHPLKAANVILRSLASALPGGGAFNEIKDGVEAAADKVADRSV
jgi:hypothetical protein